MLTRPRIVIVGAATVGLVVFAGWLGWGLGGPVPTSLARNVGAVGSSVFACVSAIFAAIRGRGPQRLAWVCFAPGLGGWVVGDLIMAHVDFSTAAQPPFPSAADAAYLLLPVSACVAALVVPGARRPGLRLLLDGVIVATSLFVVAWPLGLRAVYRADQTSALQFVMAAAYPFADLAMITIIAVLVVIIAKAARDQRVTSVLLMAALVIVGITDTAYVYVYVNGLHHDEMIVLGRAVAMYLVGISAWTSRPFPPANAPSPRPPSRVILWLPYVPVPFALVVATVELAANAGTRPLLAAGLMLILAALIRQFTLLTENRNLLVTVADIALRDPLTTLPNRALFADRLQHAMELRLRLGSSVTVLVADLDDFKLVNDSYGHPVGDELLCRVGERVQLSVREGDTVARLGGDEFAILVEDTPDRAAEIAERVVRAFDEPFVVAGRESSLRLSIGLASAPAAAADVSADELFKRAELAMYSAKRAHATGGVVFTPEMGQDAVELPLPSQRGKTGGHDGTSRIVLLADLHRAIDQSRLELVYQPKFSLATGTAVGVEALIRWPHPELGMLEPADFLPLARESGLMEALTEFVIRRAVEDAAGWYRLGIVLPVAVNLSAPSLNDAALPQRILGVLAEHGMPPSSVMVEITEDLLLASLTRTRIVLDCLRENGIRVALDDFGSGYGAMTYLHALPIDELKLDRHFVAPILHDHRAATIVQSVIELATSFGLASVAEGVEDQATADRLREYGCDYVQGHYFSRPVPARAVGLGPQRRPTAADLPSSP